LRVEGYTVNDISIGYSVKDIGIGYSVKDIGIEIYPLGYRN